MAGGDSGEPTGVLSYPVLPYPSCLASRSEQDKVGQGGHPGEPRYGVWATAKTTG